jgi:hypothetical protein
MIRVRWLLVALALGCFVSLSAMAGQTKEKTAACSKAKHTAREVFDKIAGGHKDVITEQQFVSYQLKEHSKLTKDKVESWFTKMGGTKEKGLSYDQFKKSWEEHHAKMKENKAKQK